MIPGQIAGQVAAQQVHNNQIAAAYAAVQVSIDMMKHRAAVLLSIHQRLLGDARRARDEGHAQIAVVLAQAAAEVCTEEAIDTLLEVRGVGELTDPLGDMFRATDICNERLRRVYTALSGDQIQTAPFWDRLKAHQLLRHKIVHKGEGCEVGQATESIDVVEEFIKHVGTVLNNCRAACAG